MLSAITAPLIAEHGRPKTWNHLGRFIPVSGRLRRFVRKTPSPTLAVEKASANSSLTDVSTTGSTSTPETSSSMEVIPVSNQETTYPWMPLELLVHILQYAWSQPLTATERFRLLSACSLVSKTWFNQFQLVIASDVHVPSTRYSAYAAHLLRAASGKSAYPFPTSLPQRMRTITFEVGGSALLWHPRGDVILPVFLSNVCAPDSTPNLRAVHILCSDELITRIQLAEMPAQVEEVSITYTTTTPIAPWTFDTLRVDYSRNNPRAAWTVMGALRSSMFNAGGGAWVSDVVEAKALPGESEYVKNLTMDLPINVRALMARPTSGILGAAVRLMGMNSAMYAGLFALDTTSVAPAASSFTDDATLAVDLAKYLALKFLAPDLHDTDDSDDDDEGADDVRLSPADAKLAKAARMFKLCVPTLVPTGLTTSGLGRGFKWRKVRRVWIQVDGKHVETR
ncbi:hypothetical protein PLICRDRAFT_125432 [Plicaturopsis crispa FD-325 SS-3]|nr:hypothetical protein PLICRDRAFT_125432 [Plicaturopsis crispa FD-325 SS-3]